MASYQVLKIPLSAALDRLQVVPAGQAYDFFMVVGFPAGTVASVHVGEGTDAVPVLGLGFNLCTKVPEQTGLFVSQASPGAGTLDLLVSYGGVGVGTAG